MARPCPPTLALPSAFVSGVKWAGKIPNISLESSSQTAGTITEKAAAPGTEAYETHHTCNQNCQAFSQRAEPSGPPSGVAKSEQQEANKGRLETFFAGPIRLMPFEEEDANAAGKIRAELEAA